MTRHGVSSGGGRIAFQGEMGAYSHQACLEFAPGMVPWPCASFEDAIEAVRTGEAALAMLPVDNSIYGRVADVHHLLPESGLYIIAEHFVPIRLQLLGLPGSTLDAINEAESHPVALGQCRRFLKDRGLRPIPGPDTSGSAAAVASLGSLARGAIASRLAAEIHGLEVLAADIEDASHNTTRFLVMSRDNIEASFDSGPTMTTFVFQVRNVPAALYKAMGGFATNGVNIVKLESYMVDGSFTATQFYADIEGHPASDAVRRAFDELRFFTSSLRILGVYPAAPLRR